MSIDPKNIEKVKKLLILKKDKDLAVFNELLELVEAVKNIQIKNENNLPEFPKKIKMEIEGAETVSIKGRDGKDGYTPVKGKDYFDGKDSRIPGPKGDKGDSGKDGRNGLDGDDGKDGKDGMNGRDGKDGKDGKDGSPDTPEQIKAKLQSIKEEENKLEISAIRDLRKELDELKRRPVGGGIVGRDIIKDIDISSQLNGVDKTFNIPAVWNIILVNLSSYPYGSLRKGTDYTWTPTTIIFGDSIDAATQLSSGQQCVLTVVTG